MRQLILPFLLLITLYTFSQPKLLGTLAYGGGQNGGSLYRSDLPGTAPGIVHSFDNFSSPHRPAGGLCQGPGNWFYGMVIYNGTTNAGGLYRIQNDGENFQMLYENTNFPGAGTTPYYHTDGYIYFSDEFELKKLDPITNIVTGLPLGGGIYQKHLLFDSNDWIYFQNTFGISKMKTDGSLWTSLYTFNTTSDGYAGKAGLTEAPGDTLFGTNFIGGTNDAGTIYSIKKDGTGFTVLHTFTSATGTYPESRLVYFDGKLFGTTTQGGNFNNGVLYSINLDGTGYTVLHHFDIGFYSTGPVAGDIYINSSGRIFGSYYQFYAQPFAFYRCFKIDTSGQNFEPFLNFDQRAHGHYTQDLLFVDEETFYFVSQEYGRHDGGVFNEADTTGFVSNSYHFGEAPNGFRPNTIMKASDGKVYGTAMIGGPAGNGVIFSVNPDGTGYTRLHQFSDAEGYEPSVRLLEASDGKLYGGCKWGGTGGATGCLFRMDKNGNNFQVIYNFSNFSDGSSPVGLLKEDNSGALYGTAFYGSAGYGTIFKINKDGTGYTVLKHFAGAPDLGSPYGITLFNGYLYGSCGYGGTENKGGIFRLKTDGSAYQVLHEFAGPTDGYTPAAAPLVASNGKLYGATAFGGTDGYGILFQVDTNGNNYTILRQLSQSTDGGYIWSPLIQASDGLIYGSSFLGGPSSNGTLFKINLDGSGFSVVRSFNSTEGQAGYDLLDLQGNFVLPLQWLSFTAEKRIQSVLLKWKTAQEQNTSSFDIERSADGVSFDIIGNIVAAGNTSSVTSYSFTDQQPLNGINYYRLRQIDIDGQFEYSKVVSVTLSAPGKIVIAPNPAADNLQIRLPQDNKYSALRILDASGKLVLQQSILPSSASMQLNIQSLTKGWYVLQLIGETTQQQSFLKQ